MAKSRKKSAKSLPDAYREKLKSSGLTVEDGEALGFSVLSAGEVAVLDSGFQPLMSMKIPYYGIDGQPMSWWPKHPPFYRLRYLEQAVGFDAMTKKEKKAPRYAQPAGSGICAYFPRTVDWKKTVSDPSIPIIITEGELKAAKACKEGFVCIGLGGVWNFKSAGKGIDWLPELASINWVGRMVIICFDSDMRTNTNICLAMDELANILMQEGAYPHACALPDLVGGGKTGLDDFLVASGKEAFKILLNSEAVQPLTLAKSLKGFNEKVVYIRNPGLIVDRATGQKIAPDAFKSHAFAIKDTAEIVPEDGDFKLKTTPAATAWLKWPFRLEAQELTYIPGKDRLIEGPPRRYNLWEGWGCAPKKGDVSRFLKLLDHLFSGAEAGALKWFKQWLAFPIQNPNTKLFTSAAVYGRKQGTGKSLIGYTVGEVYGKNFTELNQQMLHSSFNEWAECKQFVMGDDVTGTDKRQEADMLKKMISQKSIRINPKYVPSYEVPDCINYLFTSNQPDAFFLEDDDRRFFIHEVKVGPLDEEFYVDYDLWLHSAECGPAMFHYLLKEVDCSDFNPAARAFTTAAKTRMIADVKSDLGAWAQRLANSPDQVLSFGDIKSSYDLFTPRQLLAFYDPTSHTKTTANGVARELRRSGFHHVLNGEFIETKEGKERYFAVRNVDKWLKATRKEVEKHINTEFEEKKPEKKARF